MMNPKAKPAIQLTNQRVCGSESGIRGQTGSFLVLHQTAEMGENLSSIPGIHRLHAAAILGPCQRPAKRVPTDFLRLPLYLHMLSRGVVSPSLIGENMA